MIAGVIGWPVEHSLSPKIHSAAAKAVGVDLSYTAVPVRPGETGAALTEMRLKHIRGYSVTMPHKEAVLSDLDELTEQAVALGAVNHITNHDGLLVGNNTDGDGFIVGYEHSTNEVVKDKSVGVFGAGGAARAIIAACSSHDAGEVVVVARSAERARSAVKLGGDKARSGSVEDLDTCDIVVNATPVGMDGTASAALLPFAVASLKPGSTVVDIVYQPLETPLLIAARERGLGAVNGLAMLVGQAAEQFTTWTGVAAPMEAMFAAVGANSGK